MALSLADVVENRAGPRAASVPREPAGVHRFGRSEAPRGERFTLDADAPRVSTPAPAPSSAVRPRNASARPEPEKPSASRAGTPDERPRPERTGNAEGTRDPQARRQEVAAGVERTSAERQAIPEVSSDAPEPAMANPGIVPSSGCREAEGQAAASTPPSAYGHPRPDPATALSLPSPPPPPTSHATDAAQADPDTQSPQADIAAAVVEAMPIEDAAEAAEDAAVEGDAEALPIAQAAPSPIVPMPTPPLSPPAGLAPRLSAAAEPDDGSVRAPTVSAAPGPAADPGSVPAGFEAGSSFSIAGERMAEASAAPQAGPPAGSGPPISAPAIVEPKAAAQAQPPTQAQAASPPVPLGAVPMTIGLRALGAASRFEIRLDPVELGRIDVALDIDRARGTVEARLVVDRPETLALLQRDAASLQQALSQAGLDASEGIALSLRGGEGQGGRNGEAGAEERARAAGRNDQASTDTGPDRTGLESVPLTLLRGLGRIDIRI